MESLLQDLRYSVRSLSKRPGFTILAVFTLALGVSINTVMFCVVNSVLIQPLPFKDADRLVMIWENNLQKGRNQEMVSPPNFIDWSNHNEAFEGIAAFDTGSFTLMGVGEPEKISGASVSVNLFTLLGAHATLGRAFLPEDEQPGHDHMVILSHGFWQRRFGSDPGIIGQYLTLDGTNYAVVGVMAPGFQFPAEIVQTGKGGLEKVELWVPLTFEANSLTARGARYLRTIARLKSGVTLVQAKANMEPLALSLEQQYPANKGYDVTIIPLSEQLVGKMRSPLFILFGAVFFVLLIACLNVANLLLVRATARQMEFAIRLALGSSRLRLMRQLLTESIILAILGGVAGLLLAYWGIDIFKSSIPDGFPRAAEIGVNAWVFGFTLLISLIAGLTFGLIPSLQASKPDLNESLKEGGRGMTEGSTNTRLRRLLVVSQTALAMILLIGAGLMIKSFLRLVTVKPGFNYEDVIAMRIVLPQSKYPQAHQKVGFFRELINQALNVPGVQSASITTNLPLSGTGMNFTFTVKERPTSPEEDRSAQYHAISPGYFQTMGIPLVSGRDFTERDSADAGGVVIINKTLARRFFPDESAIGKHLVISYGKAADREVVGVIDDVKHKGLESDPQAEIYVPYLQNPWPSLTLVVRAGDDAAHMDALKSTVWSIDKDQPIDSIGSMGQLVYNSVSRPRFYAKILAIFAGLALALAAVGIYGVMSYSVMQRTHEIGVRMAMGAQQRDVLMLVVKQGLLLAFISVAIGTIGALGISRVLSSMLYGVSSTDPVIFVLISLLIIGVALVASYIPARRAANMDPTTALRYE